MSTKGQELLEKQRAYVLKKYGPEVRATMHKKKQVDTSYYVVSHIDGGTITTYRGWSGPGYRRSITHQLRVGHYVGKNLDWSYPDWVQIPKTNRKLLKVGTEVVPAGRFRHVACRCEIISARWKISGYNIRRYAQYQLRCVQEDCERPKKEFIVEPDIRQRLLSYPVTLAAIDQEWNTTVRRIMIDRYGIVRYLKERNAELISQDDWGKLWSLPQMGDEPIVMVEMVNSTPEPDGTYATYFERVDPSVRTPLEALAWQVDLTPAEYALMGEQT